MDVNISIKPEPVLYTAVQQNDLLNARLFLEFGADPNVIHQ